MTLSNGTLYDSLGNKIGIGAKVVYNLSGELASGTVIGARITKERKVTWKPYVVYDYLIEIEHIKGGGYNKPNNGISKVHNPKCIVVLKGLDNGSNI